jgi:hypothetical protein
MIRGVFSSPRAIVKRRFSPPESASLVLLLLGQRHQLQRLVDSLLSCLAR